jgi:hypothetical protein
MREKTEYKSIRHEPDGSVIVLEHFTYQESSVLAGQSGHRLSLPDCAFDSEEAARKAHPDIECTSSRLDPVASVPRCPPADFDPAYAGESWDEPE